ncbi:MAG: deoxyribonuclease IV [Candidatus Moranbacteria bacterium]|nr:deoxyribonuclease IV [Candidatus Moranbacteria bacterium]
MTKVGAHVSIAGGVENAPKNAADLGCQCFQIFTRSPRGGKRKEVDEEKFFAQCQKYGFDKGRDYIIHTPYYINLASQEKRIYQSSIRVLREELEAANQIRCPYVITHLGSSKDLNKKEHQPEIQKRVMEALIEVHQNYSGRALLVLEIAAGSGNVVGDKLEEFALFFQEAKEKGIELGFCFDTCHAFAAGCDLRTPQAVEKTFHSIDKHIGLDKLKCIHFNDSKTGFHSNKDRHEHIGEGKIGKAGMKAVAQKSRKLGVNLYLETKHDKIIDDIEATLDFLN